MTAIVLGVFVVVAAIVAAPRVLRAIARTMPDPGLETTPARPVPDLVRAKGYDLAGAKVRYTTPRTYDEARAVAATKRARGRSETGRLLLKPRRTQRSNSNVVPMSQKTG